MLSNLGSMLRMNLGMARRSLSATIDDTSEATWDFSRVSWTLNPFYRVQVRLSIRETHGCLCLRTHLCLQHTDVPLHDILLSCSRERMDGLWITIGFLLG